MARGTIRKKVRKKAVKYVLLFLLAGAFFISHIPQQAAAGMIFLQKKITGRRIVSYAQELGCMLLETETGIYYYREEEIPYLSMIRKMVDIYWPLLENQFRLEKSEKPIIVIFSKKEYMTKILGREESQAVPMGAYYGGVLNILSPSQWLERGDSLADRFLTEGPMIHEMVHMAVDQKLFYGYPLWFTEGIALFYENCYTGYEWRPDLKETASAISLEALEDHFQHIDEALAYRRAFDIIYTISLLYGQQAITQILEYMAQGISFSKAYYLTTGHQPAF